MLNDMTRQILGATIFDRKVAGKYYPNPGHEDEMIQNLFDNYKRGGR